MFGFVDGANFDNWFDNRAVNGLPYKFGLAHFVIFHSLHKEAVFFLGQAGLDYESALGCVVRFWHRHNSFHLTPILRRFFKGVFEKSGKIFFTYRRLGGNFTRCPKKFLYLTFFSAVFAPHFLRLLQNNKFHLTNFCEIA